MKSDTDDGKESPVMIYACQQCKRDCTKIYAKGDRWVCVDCKNGVKAEHDAAPRIDDSPNICAEEDPYTPAEVAKMLRVSDDTAIRWFSKEPGVIKLGNEERLHKRKKEFLRIPPSVFKRFREKHRIT